MDGAQFDALAKKMGRRSLLLGVTSILLPFSITKASTKTKRRKEKKRKRKERLRHVNDRLQRQTERRNAWRAYEICLANAATIYAPDNPCFNVWRACCAEFIAEEDGAFPSSILAIGRMCQCVNASPIDCGFCSL